MAQFEDRYGDHEDVSISYVILAATDYTTANTKIAAKAGHTIFIRKITLSVTTDNAATQSFQDDAGTPIQVATSKASPGLGPIVWDFGARGFALTEGQAFMHDMSAAGMAAAISVEAYRKRTANESI